LEKRESPKGLIKISSFRALSGPWKKRHKQKKKGARDQEQGYGPGEKNGKTTMGHDQRLPEGIFHQWAQHEREDQGGPFVGKLLHEVANDSEDDHDDHFEYVIVDTVYPD
jgi:hypothetical protein